MAVNRDKPDWWNADVAQSVDMYNDWFIRFAPMAYRSARAEAIGDVEAAFSITSDLTAIDASQLRSNPGILPVLRMATCPPLAVDRLIGLAKVPPNLVRVMERDSRLPPRMSRQLADSALLRVAEVIQEMIDKDILVWLERGRRPSRKDRYRAATVVADRLCGAVADPTIRNAHEERQLAAIAKWLENRGYVELQTREERSFDKMNPGTFAFRLNVPAKQENTDRQVNIPVDAVIMPKASSAGDLPLLVEAKSAGDFANVNKRRKEESTKNGQLRHTYGNSVTLVLFLCGYFDSGYLGYEAAAGIDWVWEHRIGDLEKFGL